MSRLNKSIEILLFVCTLLVIMLPFGPTDPNVKTFFWKFTICQPQIMKGSQHQLLPVGLKAFKSESMLCDRKLKSCLRIICFISRYCSKL